MRGATAKRIRREVYGEQSVRQPRWYVKLLKRGPIRLKSGDLRSLYKLEKKDFKENREWH